jgi:hypothetical protein
MIATLTGNHWLEFLLSKVLLKNIKLVWKPLVVELVRYRENREIAYWHRNK